MEKTIDIIQNMLCDREPDEFGFMPRVPRVQCKDGFSMSIQAGESLYSDPQLNVGPYSEVEVGFPSEIEKALQVYSDNPETNNTVYPFVPIKLVAGVIDSHGGLK